MNKKIDIIQRKKIRGYTLRTIADTYPRAVFDSAVAQGVIGYGWTVNPDISEYTTYLVDKGYVEVIREAENYGIREQLLKVTPKGIDLLEGTITDPGVEV